ncbi:ferritin [Aminithiophilus ramosus]|uniref:Ferritin n=2 Tax=Synergistales TaxID=649776 RepID=A0A9Q7AF30_9BACT|nr:ferritin-like domain-containing protein [Aminithiophilus ramosus]QTX32074.1 ferritin [Aminithiophilus ramosus]QVL35940.1 ferritin [Synergistota bacterium]
MYHEPVAELTSEARDIVRALNSLKEEIEAVDWYHQRLTASQDEAIKAILKHNRDEEIEHAAMVLEWLRRTMPEVDEALRTYLFTEAPITEIEESATGDEAPASSAGTRSLGIGRLGR